MDFKQKVQSMTAKEIIMAMVQGLTRPPIINIDMDTYGRVENKKYFFGLLTKKTCFGCAATNTVCKISGKVFTPQNIFGATSRAEFINTDKGFLLYFEVAINALRIGYISGYNMLARSYGFATISCKDRESLKLPVLNSNYTNDDLIPYKILAEMQD